MEKQVALDVDTHAVGERLWRICNPKAEGTTLEFADYVLLVGALVRGSAEVHATLVFEIFDLNDDGALRIDDMFVAMHQGFDDALRDDFAMLCNIAKAKIDAGRVCTAQRVPQSSQSLTRARADLGGGGATGDCRVDGAQPQRCVGIDRSTRELLCTAATAASSWGRNARTPRVHRLHCLHWRPVVARQHRSAVRCERARACANRRSSRADAR